MIEKFTGIRASFTRREEMKVMAGRAIFRSFFNKKI